MNEPNTKPIPKKIKLFVWGRDAGTCQDCGAVFTPDLKSFHIHHKTPRALGGSNDPDNLALLCGKCHAKYDKPRIAKLSTDGDEAIIRLSVSRDLHAWFKAEVEIERKQSGYSVTMVDLFSRAALEYYERRS